MIEFILSRLDFGQKNLHIITLAKKESLNKEWENVFAAPAEVI